jgi:hypothetical protein
LFVSCVVFSFIDTYNSPSLLSVLDENESAERSESFHKGMHIEKLIKEASY